ncbi:MAG TPA: lipoprotein [Steroidobacteraceae bacterium]|nr:lipoprotein [Steroidobacteraceae bacterium]
MRRLVSIAIVAPLLLWGCGIKGPLYLPPKNAAVVTTPAPTSSGAAAPATPAATSPSATTPATAPTPAKPGDKDQDSQSQSK